MFMAVPKVRDSDSKEISEVRKNRDYPNYQGYQR